MVRGFLIVFLLSTFGLKLMGQENSIRYVALGDSYTIGEGTTEDKSWPSVMVENLNEKDISIELIANPSVTGWTTQDLIDKELPIFDKSDADFVTLLIGVNDWVQQVSVEKFESNLNFILDHVQNGLEDPNMILLVTIPDFSVTPDGPKYSKGRDISLGLMEFNKIIERVAKERKLPVVDLFEVSKEMYGQPDLIAADNLHPSDKTYARWEEVIRPEVEKILK